MLKTLAMAIAGLMAVAQAGGQEVSRDRLKSLWRETESPDVEVWGPAETELRRIGGGAKLEPAIITALEKDLSDGLDGEPQLALAMLLTQQGSKVGAEKLSKIVEERFTKVRPTKHSPYEGNYERLPSLALDLWPLLQGELIPRLRGAFPASAGLQQAKPAATRVWLCDGELENVSVAKEEKSIRREGAVRTRETDVARGCFAVGSLSAFNPPCPGIRRAVECDAAFAAVLRRCDGTCSGRDLEALCRNESQIRQSYLSLLVLTDAGLVLWRAKAATEKSAPIEGLAGVAPDTIQKEDVLLPRRVFTVAVFE